MGGGLLNLIATGNQNVILNGNPKKTFFRSTYSKYTNFGLQKFRIDFTGLRNFKVKEESQFNFKIPRYGDLLLDTYLVVTLPNIWSPIYRNYTIDSDTETGKWVPYEFKWIPDLGTQMIKEITITAGGATLQQYSGNALTALYKRDLTDTELCKHNEMIGNITELNDPANYGIRNNQYPNAVYDIDYLPVECEPSIRSRNIYIPIRSWFSGSSKQGFPLASMQYNELNINITLKPVNELYVIKEVDSSLNYMNYVKPSPNNDNHEFYRFLVSPPEHDKEDYTYKLKYTDKRTDWNSDVHLISTYAFLSDEENRYFAINSHDYLIKDIYEYTFNGLRGSSKLNVPTTGLVSSWTFFFRRDDVKDRNQWSNYTNWSYDTLPVDVKALENKVHSSGGLTLDFSTSNIYEAGQFQYENDKNILVSMGILCDGKYRENVFESGIFQYLENYLKTRGSCKDGLYTYNFCIDSDPKNFQPSGAINFSKFKNIELEIVTIEPPQNPNFEFKVTCEDGEVTSIVKTDRNMFLYTYDMHVIEERYNVVSFMSGNCGLKFAR